MGVYAGPDVSESGLVFALDAGNNKSHSTNRFISYGSGLVTEGIGFQVNGTGTFQRVSAGTVIGGYTVKTTDVVYSYALGSDGCHYHGNDVPIPAGVYATFSFDYLVTGATNYPSTNYLANFENAFSNSIGTANNLQNVWQRRSFTSGPTGSAGTLRMLLYPGGCGGRLADSGTLYFKNPKVEFTNVDTGDGNFSSMPNVTTWYDMSGNGNNGTLTNGTQYYNDGFMYFNGDDEYVNLGSFFNYQTFTIELWVKPGTTQTTYADIFDNNHTGTQNFVLQQNAGNLNQYAFGVIDASGTISSTGTIILTANTWTHLAFTFSPSTRVIAYVNGDFYSQGNLANGRTINYVSPNLSLGRWSYENSRFWKGNISNFKTYNRILTASEVQQNFNANRSRFGI